jgi:hypothetical protein
MDDDLHESLKAASLVELEAIYRDAPLGPPPEGLHRGRVLRLLPTLEGRPLLGAIDRLLFQLTPFGVDFDRRLWWFLHPRLAAGRFDATLDRSRWRPAETYRLTYRPSWLPFRGLLYDEIKPLDRHTCLGIGGVSAGAGRGDHFFFALRREAERPQPEATAARGSGNGRSARASGSAK